VIRIVVLQMKKYVDMSVGLLTFGVMDVTTKILERCGFVALLTLDSAEQTNRVWNKQNLTILLTYWIKIPTRKVIFIA
jgi:hypothetical protein